VVKISKPTGIWNKLIPTLVDDFRGFKITGEVTADIMDISGELELQVELRDIYAFLKSDCETLTGEEMLPRNEQREWFLEMESTPLEDVLLN
jgi:hypothetical protein